MATLITMGVDYAQLLSDLKAAFRSELDSVLASSTTSLAELGGIELAQEITRLSKPRIYALVAARQIPHSKRGKKLYFNRANLLDWIAAGNRQVKEVAYA